MIKSITIALSLMLVQSISWASQNTFDCKNTFGNSVVSMNVINQGNGFIATLEGATVNGPVSVQRDIESAVNSLDYPGIREIIRAVGFTSAEWSKVSEVVIFTYGNFDDDAAGVRGANFMDEKGNLIKKGMYFGWGGPLSCK